MATLLLNLRHVPDDESDDVRTLLDANGIEWYETPPSRWGVSGGAIWLADEARAAAALALLDEYQRQRVLRARAARNEARRDGTAPGWIATMREHPLRLVAAVLATAFVAALLALPVYLLAQ
ncbi:MAG: hypothetical protein EOP90_13255 [Lysobacteraceae bacterium]|nr:MAG: hypothetical protein EOP90_13255 [Xanthomonadaceae bacterium]